MGFVKQVFDVYNKYCIKYKVLLLMWLDEIVKEVQVWVEKLVCVCKLQYVMQKECKGYGENIVMFFGRFEIVVDEVINMWYSEVKDYRFDKFGF